MTPKPKKADVIIEAFKVSRTGQVVRARGYLRHGQVYSDVVLFQREDLLSLYKKGTCIVVGKRKPNMAASFTELKRLYIVTVEGKQYFSLNTEPVTMDRISGTPSL